MAIIAKSSITLASISDAYSVSLQPSNITISADCTGKNAQLDNAYTRISLYCGDQEVPITSAQITNSSLWIGDEHLNKTDALLNKDGDGVILRILTIGNQLFGWRDIAITTNAGQILTARFSYTVVRETTLLDWILDWNKELTQINGQGVATPNAFIGGQGEREGTLSGVYIGGRESGHPYKPGIYGIKNCNTLAFTQGYMGGCEIFSLNEDGGMIAGWEIRSTGLTTTTTTGQLYIEADGTIRHYDNKGGFYWSLNSDGSGTLAHGKIWWDSAEGSAHFEGHLTAKSGTIGGWNIEDSALTTDTIYISGTEKYIGIRNVKNYAHVYTKAFFTEQIMQYGGINIYYNSEDDYGIEGFTPHLSAHGIYAGRVFKLGSDNQIANWHFDNTSLWSYTDTETQKACVNTIGNYTTVPNAITIGSNGIRGNHWRLESDGSGALADGKIWWDVDGTCEFKGELNGNIINGAQISGGTITAVDYIKSENDAWQLNNDGSGVLANGNVSWSGDGTVDVRGGLRADTMEYSICTLMENGYIDGSTGSFIAIDTPANSTLILPKLRVNVARIFYLQIPQDCIGFRLAFADDNVTYTLAVDYDMIYNNGGNAEIGTPDEDGLIYIDCAGFAGEWVMLVGIKSNLNWITTHFYGTQSQVVWEDGRLIKKENDFNNSPQHLPSLNPTKTHWTLLPMSAKFQCWLMGMMGLEL